MKIIAVNNTNVCDLKDVNERRISRIVEIPKQDDKPDYFNNLPTELQEYLNNIKIDLVELAKQIDNN